MYPEHQHVVFFLKPCKCVDVKYSCPQHVCKIMVASKAYGFSYVHVCNHQPSRAVCVYYPLEQERLGLACCRNELDLKVMSAVHSCEGFMQIRSVLARKRSRGARDLQLFRNLPLTTSVCGQHAVVASSSVKPIQLCTFGRSIARCILLST